MSSDIGPNRSKESMAYFPLHEGFLVSPSVSILMGNNSSKKVHVNPFEFRLKGSSPQYFIVLCELVVRCDKLRVPCLYNLKKSNGSYNDPKYRSKIPAEFYVINDMNAFLLRAILMKKLSHEEFIDYNKQEFLASRIGLIA